MKYGLDTWVVQYVEPSGRPWPNAPPKGDDGGYWKIYRGGESGKLYDTKSQARSAAKTKAKNIPGRVELVIETKDGGVSNRYTYEDEDDGMPTAEDMLGL